MSLHIEGRRWFQKSYGNTYHSVRIFLDGKQIAHIPQSYGYGDQYLQTAREWLRSNGYPDMEYGTLYLRETMGGTCSVIDVARERDL